MNLNLEVAERDVYNLLDWIRSLGGFQRGLRTIFFLFIYAFTYKNYETYMVSQLYKRPNKEARNPGSNDDELVQRKSDKLNTEEFLKQKHVNPLKMFFFDLLPNKCKNFFKRSILCRRSKSYIYFEKGINQYLEEIDIVKLLQEIRYLRTATLELV